MNVVLLAVACYGPYLAISGTLDVVQHVRHRRAERVFVVPTTLIQPTASAHR